MRSILYVKLQLNRSDQSVVVEQKWVGMCSIRTDPPFNSPLLFLYRLEVVFIDIIIASSIRGHKWTNKSSNFCISDHMSLWKNKKRCFLFGNNTDCFVNTLFCDYKLEEFLLSVTIIMATSIPPSPRITFKWTKWWRANITYIVHTYIYTVLMMWDLCECMELCQHYRCYRNYFCMYFFPI